MSETTYVVKFSTADGAKVFEFTDYEKALERYRTPYWGNSAECLITVPDSIGPFPQEPAPGSPEAVAQAAETIWRDMFTPEVYEHELVEHLRLRDLILDRHIFVSAINGSFVSVYRDEQGIPYFDDGHQKTLSRIQGAEILNLRQQRDELADALDAAQNLAEWVQDHPAGQPMGTTLPGMAVDLLRVIDAALAKVGR